MRRLLVLPVAPLLVAILLTGCTSGSASHGIAAFTVAGHDTSQQSFDEELEVLAENPALKRVVSQGGGAALSRADGSISSDLAAGWLTQLIGLDLVARDRARQGVDITAADRSKGRELAIQNVGGRHVYDTLPGWFRERVTRRWVEVAALQRELLASSAQEVKNALREQCPSGRYVSHILVATRAEAEQIAGQLDAGADFAELARRRSTDQGAASQGGQLGCADGQQFVEPFATVAATQPPGQVSDPVQTQFGFHLIRISTIPPQAELDRVTLGRILGRARGADVEVDPRYGTWDRKNGRVVPPRA